MSEEQKPKLNLKALDSSKPTESEDTTNPTTVENTVTSEKKEEGKVSEINLEKSPSEEVDNQKEKKSFKISFSDIKKKPIEKTKDEPISEKDSGIKTGQDQITASWAIGTDVVKDELLGDEKIEQGKIENESAHTKESTAHQTQKTKIETLNSVVPNAMEGNVKDDKIEEKRENKDKLVMENAAKAQGIMQEKELENKKKRKGFLSLFSRWKKKISQKETSNNDTLALEDESQEHEVGIIETVKEKIHFENYESHFKQESSNFLKKFQKFKYTPKTRIWLIIGLISITCIIIWGLMIFMPDKHSPAIYKASIVQILWNTPEDIWEIDTIKIPKNTDIVPINKEIQEEKIWEKNRPNTQEKKERSKEKLREHLLNKYSS